jgi:mRNA interferase MazF
MKPGNIVLTIIPQDNLQKKRPVLILKILPKYNDFLVCAVSSQLYQYIAGFDLMLKDSDPAC